MKVKWFFLIVEKLTLTTVQEMNDVFNYGVFDDYHMFGHVLQ